jgi:MFS transporter, UMF1 family
MYDWSNSVYQLTIVSTIFPIYYNQVTKGIDYHVSFFGFDMINSVLYSWSIAFAYLIIAVCSPFLSSIADYTGRRKAFMKFFTWIGAISCGLLFFFTGSNVEWGIICFTLGTLGYTGSIVYYNSYLPVIAEPEKQDMISARGYAMGYLGGVTLLLINLLIITKPDLFGITNRTIPARLAFLSVFIWWMGFSRITFARLPKYTFGQRNKKANVLLNGYQELQKVSKYVWKSRRIKIFLSAYFFIMMGLLSVMFMASTYGQKQVGLDQKVLIPTILLIQLLGILGAWLFARISAKIGNIRSMTISVGIWCLICIGAYFISNAFEFIVAAIFIGIVMGGTQSLARSTYSKMLPVTKDHTSFFSFFDVMEKLATVGGLFIFGAIEAITGSMRNSVISIILFFLIGLSFLILNLQNERLSRIVD